MLSYGADGTGNIMTIANYDHWVEHIATKQGLDFIMGDVEALQYHDADYSN
jgi:hypothetical protein